MLNPTASNRPSNAGMDEKAGIDVGRGDAASGVFTTTTERRFETRSRGVAIDVAFTTNGLPGMFCSLNLTDI